MGPLVAHRTMIIARLAASIPATGASARDPHATRLELSERDEAGPIGRATCQLRAGGPEAKPSPAQCHLIEHPMLGV